MYSILLACKAVHAAQQGQPLTEAEIKSRAHNAVCFKNLGREYVDDSSFPSCLTCLGLI